MIRLSRSEAASIALFFVVALFAVPASAQNKTPTPPEDYTWWYVSLFVLVTALAGAVAWTLKSRKAAREVSQSERKKAEARADADSWETGAVDADRELEWYRQAKKASNAKNPIAKKKKLTDALPKAPAALSKRSERSDRKEFTEREIKEKLLRLQFSQLPISKLKKLELARPFSPLPLSNDDALMSAIEQTQDEYEEDEAVRELAVRILARFKTRNSVESLAQVALYDLSSNLRSKAVSILADFDHESVFETMLLCCADPTREVRAAAARGLFRLSFDRADAWTRIAETNEEFRMRQAARAAMEAELVLRSLDRLVHQDHKIAYEAFTLLALMIKTGETDELFDAVETHRDENVKLAFLRVIEVVGDDRVIPRLEKMLNQLMIPKEMKDRIEEVIASFELVAA
ncbi:MAG: HEAT repeat domain-containing protein [Acidobacteria bacterium]|nr:HEAT repeat domain-containing protein [Acidobacteriota bacterium]